MVKRQMELGLADLADTRRRTGSASPSSRASWWFEQMRAAVENPLYQMPRSRRLRRAQLTEADASPTDAESLQTSTQ